MPTGQAWIEQLGLTKHPEGGYFRENYRSPEQIPGNGLAKDRDGARALATSIYFLLLSGEVSHLHRLKSDELWYFHTGSALTVTVIDTLGDLHHYKLGLNGTQNEQPQLILPAGCIFGASVNEPDSFTLVGCMVTPGFDFRDFELCSREELLGNFPQHQEVIQRLAQC